MAATHLSLAGVVSSQGLIIVVNICNWCHQLDQQVLSESVAPMQIGNCWNVNMASFQYHFPHLINHSSRSLLQRFILFHCHPLVVSFSLLFLRLRMCGFKGKLFNVNCLFYQTLISTGFKVSVCLSMAASQPFVVVDVVSFLLSFK